MATYEIRAFSAQNLLNASGEQSFGSTDTNGPASPSGTFTTGSEIGSILTITDNDPDGGTSDRDSVFDDGTGAQQFLAEAVTLTYAQGGSIVTATFPAGTQIQAEFTQTFSNGFQVIALRFEDPNASGGLVTAGYTFFDPAGNASAPPPNTELGTHTGGNPTGDTSVDNIACFTQGAMVATSRGLVRIEHVRVGDTVITRGRGAQPVTWTGTRDVTVEAMLAKPMLRPVAFASADGDDRCLLSPQHRLWWRDPAVELYFGTTEALLPAMAFVDVGCARQYIPVTGVRYHHLAFERHEVILVDGRWSESLLDDDMMQVPCHRARQSARPCLTRKEAALVLRGSAASVPQKMPVTVRPAVAA
ncbi:MAG: Hint domain-containing protein [Pseudomonadota bacterium]